MIAEMPTVGVSEGMGEDGGGEGGGGERSFPRSQPRRGGRRRVGRVAVQPTTETAAFRG